MAKFYKSFIGIAFMYMATFVTPVQAYTWTFTNLLKEDVAVDFCLVAKIGCTAFGGWYPKDRGRAEPETFGNTTRYNNAHELRGPQVIKAGHTVEFNFKWEYIGYCIDIPTIKVGLKSEGFSIYKRPMLRAPDEYMAQLIGEINKTGDGISDAGSSLGKTGVKQAQIAGAATQAVGSLLKSFSNLIVVSACKPGQFFIVKDDTDKGKNKIKVATSDFGGE